MAPDRPQMTPKAPIWWESTKNASRTPFQYKRVAPASLGPKGPPKFFSLWARWRRAPQGARSAFSPHYIILRISVTPKTKNWGPGAPRPQSALIFPKHVFWGHFGPKWAPGGAGWAPSSKFFFGMCSSLVPPYVYQFLSWYLHPRLRSEGGRNPPPSFKYDTQNRPSKIGLTFHYTSLSSIYLYLVFYLLCLLGTQDLFVLSLHLISWPVSFITYVLNLLSRVRVGLETGQGVLRTSCILLFTCIMLLPGWTWWNTPFSVGWNIPRHCGTIYSWVPKEKQFRVGRRAVRTGLCTQSISYLCLVDFLWNKRTLSYIYISSYSDTFNHSISVVASGEDVQS